jgi:hypothetical protein
MAFLWEYLGAWASTTKGLFHLNWGATDSSWNGNDWNPTNISWVGGKLWSGSASLNGTNAYISLWTNNIIPTTSWQPITISFWMKSNVPQSWWSVKQVITLRWWFEFWFDHTVAAYRWAFSYANSWLTYWSSWATSLSSWVWYHIVWIYDWNAIKMYTNWVISWSVSIWTQVRYADNNNTIWASFLNWAFFNWLIDEVIIENRAWTEQEIKKYYTFSRWLYIL